MRTNQVRPGAGPGLTDWPTGTSVDHLTERVDEVLPLIEDDHPHKAAELRDANAAVKRVI